MISDELKAELLDVGLEAARQAGALLRDGRPADLAVAATKTSPIDVVTEMDIAAEKLITGILAERRPEDGLLGEEGADTPGTSGVRWVVDPLDGTVNYLYGLPSWGVSIAAEYGGETVVGVVAAPMRGETYHAVLGGGAWLGTTPSPAGRRRRWTRRCWGPDSRTCRPDGPTRPRSRRGSSRWCGTSGGAARRRWTCATWPPDGWTGTTSGD